MPTPNTSQKYIVFTKDGYVYICTYEYTGCFHEIYEGYKIKPDNVHTWKELEVPDGWFFKESEGDYDDT